MLPEVVTAIIRELKSHKESVDVREQTAVGQDRQYWAGMSAAYALALALVTMGPGSKRS